MAIFSLMASVATPTTPLVGRWITADPQGFNDGPNLYAYLHNSPLTDFDLYGLWSWSGFRQGLYRWTDRSMQFACPLTHQLGRHDNLFAKALMLPTAIFEVGTLVGTAAPRAALSLAEKSIEQIGRHAMQRLSSRAAMQAERVIATGIEHKLLQSNANRALAKVPKGGVERIVGPGKRNRFVPDINATGAHSVYRRDPISGRVTHYETYKPQTNPFDPKPWKSVVRYENKVFDMEIHTPHIHDPNWPGEIRPANLWEIPK